jgi:hypothetical protein
VPITGGGKSAGETVAGLAGGVSTIGGASVWGCCLALLLVAALQQRQNAASSGNSRTACVTEILILPTPLRIP